MTCEVCGASTGWTDGVRLERANESKREALERARIAEKQRDVLLEALENITRKCNLDMHGDDGSLGGYAYGIWNTANSAIVSVKGDIA